jgi:uncharacterized membrane protein
MKIMQTRYEKETSCKKMQDVFVYLKTITTFALSKFFQMAMDVADVSAFFISMKKYFNG